jgi:hypothetical protein
MGGMDNDALNSWHVSPNLLKRGTMTRSTVDPCGLIVINKYSHLFLYMSQFFKILSLIFDSKVEEKNILVKLL